MKGLGTNEDCLIRILVSRCEIDMVQIKKKFQDLYKQSLVEWLKVFSFFKREFYFYSNSFN